MPQSLAKAIVLHEAWLTSFSWPDVVRQPAAVDAHAAGQHQRHDAGAVEQVVVIPVVGARADDDQVLAVRLFGVLAPLAGEAQQRIAVDAGVLFLPGRGVGPIVVV